MGRLDAVSWRVDYTLAASELREVNEPLIQLRLQAQGVSAGSTETTVVSVSADKFRVLLTGYFCILPSQYFHFKLFGWELSWFYNYFPLCACRAQTGAVYDECTAVMNGGLGWTSVAGGMS